MEQTATMRALYEKARLLPAAPGVYQMFGEDGGLLYVGKSKALKNRVSSYFQPGAKNAKTEKLVSLIRSFETIRTDTEQEALLLENELIKLHKPKYNILLKDDKNYPYLYLPVHEDYPRPRLMRSRREKDRGLYFGPYSSSATVYELIRTANRLFALPRCKKHFPQEIGRGRPCLYHDMGRCMGVCSGSVTPEEYRKTVDEMILFFKHDHKKLTERLEQEMYAHAAAERFEAAAAVRDNLRALEKLSEKQHVLASPEDSADVYALGGSEALPIVTRLCVRRGRLIDATHFAFGAAQIVDAESFSALLYDRYRTTEDLPRRVLLSPELFDPEDTLLPELLHKRAGHLVPVSSPVRGEGAKLVSLARENAEKESEHRLSAQKQDKSVLNELAELLGLEKAPKRIEAYDISNSASDVIVGGMVVLIDASPRRSLYRTFKLEQEQKDDYAAMDEVLLRRMRHLEEEGWEKPDLILLDGGKAHVSVVGNALAAAGHGDIPVFGMVKDEHHKTRTLTDDTGEISIARYNAVFGLVYQLQEEVHRYSITRMDATRRKKMVASTLTKIPGIGKEKEARLLKHFRTVKAVRAADKAALLQVPGIGEADAENILTYFAEQKKD